MRLRILPGTATLVAILLLGAGCATRVAERNPTYPRAGAAPTGSALASVVPAPTSAVSAPTGAVSAPTGAVSASTPSPGSVRSRAGGYYRDDGPGDAPPPNLEALPDAQPWNEPVRERNARPYVVFGREYVPMSELRPYRERGIASWYGRRFHSLPTATGEPYDMYAMTAAHPTLPLPSYVRVTSLADGRSVVVRVNDRGPFLHGRAIDLSYAAAAKLGFVTRGSAEVDIELILVPERSAPALAVAAPPVLAQPALQPAPQPALQFARQPAPQPVPQPVSPSVPPVRSPSLPPAPSAFISAERLNVETSIAAAPTPAPEAPARIDLSTSAAGVYLQLGAFASREGAQATRARLAGQIGWLAERLVVRADAALFKVQAGPWDGPEDARAAAQRILLEAGVPSFTLTR